MPSSARLSPRQKDVVRAIIRLTKRTGYPPTIREITLAIGVLSNYATACHLRALRRKGAIVWQPRLSRTIKVFSSAAEEAEASSEIEPMPAG